MTTKALDGPWEPEKQPSEDLKTAGYTPGYYGTVVSNGTVVYGTGYAYPPHVGSTVWYGPPITYGCGVGVTYTPWTGWTYGFGFGWSWGTVTVGWGWGAYPFAGVRRCRGKMRAAIA